MSKKQTEKSKFFDTLNKIISPEHQSKKESGACRCADCCNAKQSRPRKTVNTSSK